MIYVVAPTVIAYKKWLSQHSQTEADALYAHDEYLLAGVGVEGDRFVMCKDGWNGTAQLERRESLLTVLKLAASKAGAIIEWSKNAPEPTGSGSGRNDRVVPVDPPRRQVLLRADRYKSRGW